MQGNSFTVVYDACVLYPAPLRDLLMWLALSDLFRAKWTEEIHEEWISNVLENRPDLTRQQLERTKQLMNQNVRDCLVTGYEQLIKGLELPDEFILHLIDLNPELVCQAVKNQLNTLKKPHLSLEKLLEVLEKQQLSKSLEILKELLLK
jgi:hypothetical protein